MRKLLVAALIVFIGAIAYWFLRPSPESSPTNAALESLLVDDGQTAGGFARAKVPGAVAFPRDLGSHEDYQTEWWYYTGNLHTEDGRDFGYQFTIFRRALQPEDALLPVENASAWRTNQTYLAHFTISDIDAGAFHDFERFSRGGAGLAGASSQPYRVWLEDWSVSEIAPGQTRIQAAAEELSLDLTLQETLPPVLHGDGGLSRKGPEPGNASYYYSIVQQKTSGKLAVGEDVFDVSGLSWKDHEYSTSALSPGSIGWDWFSLQLNNGSALMLFQIRREDGTTEPNSSGSFIDVDGTVQGLAREDWQLDVLDTWRSPASGADYPSRWRLQIPVLDLTMEGGSLMADQELNVSTIYWEGAVDFAGTMAAEPVKALGYIEMTGYAGTPAPS